VHEVRYEVPGRRSTSSHLEIDQVTPLIRDHDVVSVEIAMQEPGAEGIVLDHAFPSLGGTLDEAPDLVEAFYGRAWAPEVSPDDAKWIELTHAGCAVACCGLMHSARELT